MGSIFLAAGWPIWFLLLASIIALALIIERAIVLRHSKILPPNLLDEVVGLYRTRKVTPDVLTRLENNSPLGRVLAAGLRNEKASREVMKESIEEAGRAVTHELERFLDHLGTIATAAPLLGPVRHGDRHDRDLRLAGRREHQPGAARARHLDLALQHGVRPDRGDPLADLLPPLPREGGRLVVEMEQQAIKFVDFVHGERKLGAGIDESSRTRGRDDPEINLIPLIDLFLVIIIFLMVTTTYQVRRAADHAADGRRRAGAAAARPRSTSASTQDGRYVIDGRRRLRATRPASPTRCGRSAADAQGSGDRHQCRRPVARISR